jgi:peptidyl-prolyl cis-trans isomerase SurA
VAVVNGEIITLHDLQQQVDDSDPGMDQQGTQSPGRELARQRRILEAMINDKLIVQEAEKFKIEVSDAEIDNQIQHIRSENNLSQAEFAQVLAEQGMEMDQYRQALREEIKKNRVLSNMVRQKVVVSEDEMMEFYQQHQNEYNQPKQVHLRIIVHPSKNKLEQVRQAVASEEMTFSQAANSVSQGPGADQGGDLGTFMWKDLKAQWREMLRDMHSGQMSPIFSLQGNYALLYLQDLADKQVQPFQAVKDDIREQIYAQKLKQRYKEYMQGLREKAVIDVRLQGAN